MDSSSSILTILQAIMAMMLYTSFEAFVQGFQAMDSKAPETVKVHLILAPTGSGKTTRFISEMVRKYPNVLFVLCLPRVLACNVAYYLRSQYGLNVCVKNGKSKGKPTADTQVLIMTYQSAVNAFVSNAIIDRYACGRQVSLIFDECHETCAQATLLFELTRSLLIKHPKFLHSLICISATMDAEELSKRLGGIDPSLIRVSQIESPAKSFEKGKTHVIPIEVGNFVEEEEGGDTEQLSEEQNMDDAFLKSYCTVFKERVIQMLGKADTPLSASSVVICAGINSANYIQEQLYEALVRARKQPVIIWNTFVEPECPVDDRNLSRFHMIILGSHMKLGSSITLRQCCRLMISEVMQVASPNLTNSTTMLNLGIIPESVKQQSVGRGNRDCPTEVYLFPIVFCDGVVHSPRLAYPPQEPVSEFMVRYIRAIISGSLMEQRQLFAQYRISDKTAAASLFFSHSPVDILLEINSYSKLKVSKENKTLFERSINFLRVFTHTCAYISNGSFQVQRNEETVRNDTEFARLLGFFILDVVNRIIDAPIQRSDELWNTFFQREVDIQKGVSQIRQVIACDGLGTFTLNGEQTTVTPKLVSEILDFASNLEPRIVDIFVKNVGKAYVMKPNEDTGTPTIGVSIFSLPVILPFQTIISGKFIPLFPLFFMEIPPVVKKDVEELSEFNQFLNQFRRDDVIERLRNLMDCIPANTDFTSESFLNPTRYPNGILPDNIREYNASFKKVNKSYTLLKVLIELGLMRIGPNGKYQRNF